MTSDVIKPDGYQDVRREVWIHRTPAEFVPSSATSTPADAETIARWVRRLADVMSFDMSASPAYRLSRLGISGSLAAQVLAAYEEAE